jgi:predicted RND superfamily exporter protein
MQTSIIHRILAFSTRRPWLVIGLTLAATAVFAFFAIRVRVDADYGNILPKDAEVNTLIREYGGTKAGSQLLVIAIEGPELYALPTLKAFADQIDRIAAQPGITSVLSPFNLLSFSKGEGGRLQIGPINEGGKPPADQTELAAFRQRLAATRLAKNLVVAKDGSLLAAFFQAEKRDSYADLMTEVKAAVARLALPGITTRVSGTIPFGARTGYYISRDLVRLVLLAALIILAFYYLGFRAKRAVALPFIVVVFGTVWAVGLMGMLGFSLTLISIVAPPLIMIFGSEYSIYVMTEYFRVAGRGGETRAAGAPQGSPIGGVQSARLEPPIVTHAWIGEAVTSTAMPILMAFVTTIIGFLSLCVTDIRQTQEFAITASAGSLACGFLALFFLPALLTLFRAPREDRTRRLLEGPMARFMAGVTSLVSRRPVLILASLPVIAAAFLLTTRLLVFNTDSVNYFPQQDPFIKDMYALTSRIGGFDEIAVSYDAPEGRKGYFLDPAILRGASAVERSVLADPDVCYSISMPSLLSDINLALTGQEEVPANRAVVALFSRLVGSAAASASGSLLANMVNADGTRLTLSFRIYNSTTGHFMDESRFRGFVAQLRKTVADNPVGDAKPVIWGEILRSLSLADSLRRFLIISMLISLALIFIVATVAFRSPIYGLYAVVPLATGLMLNFILMAVGRIPLDMTTIMVANVTIGVGIDGGIYLVIQYLRERRRHPGDFPKAIGQTLHAMGRAIILSTFSIVTALLVFASAAFKPIVYFGLLVIFSLTATAAGTLTLLPALLNVDSRIRARRDRAKQADAARPGAAT